MSENVVWFSETGMADVPVVGGKNASLGEMVRELATVGVHVPDGFATTARAYWRFIEHNNLEDTIRRAIADYRAGHSSLRSAGETVREAIAAADFPPALAAEILADYRELSGRAGIDRLAVAVRSSATAEDLPDASFAGQQETFLNVRGDREVLDACRRCYASLFTDRAISYRDLKGFDHLQVAVSVGVQRMVRSDLAGSGVMFSIDTESGFPRVAVISAAWGLGETVVQGEVDPDKYMVFKPLLDDPRLAPIVEKSLGAKAIKLVYGRGGTVRTRRVETTPRERRAFVLGDDEIVQLARWASLVERHYGRPMDMEWAKDGASGELFLVQARSETVQARKAASEFTVSKLTGSGDLLASGAAIGQSIASGEVCVIRDPSELEKFRDGAILVTEMTDPDWVPIMSKAAGIITDHGGSTSHAAIVSRELGIPAVVGTGDGSHILGEGAVVTLCCAEGEEGHVYAGRIPFETMTIDVSNVPRTQTKLMVNIASPAAAFEWWRLPARGVGLARMEFIINNLITVHPMALVHPERVSDPAERRQIAALTSGWADPEEFFVSTLARGIAKLATPFHPNPVIVRMSDFKTNEYAHLLGGRDFEHVEENPMIGFRGASRYYDARYREGFALECAALARVRGDLGFDNVILMIPFCRTPGEADRVLTVMADNGLERGRDGLQVYMMCEIPSNVIAGREFAKRFDGFSIGSNDLTQLILGVDRDSGELSGLFDERDPAVEDMVAQAIAVAHRAGIKIGICGQAPSNYPEFAQFLVREGIDSISLNPDSFLRTAQYVAEAETLLAAPVVGTRARN